MRTSRTVGIDWTACSNASANAACSAAGRFGFGFINTRCQITSAPPSAAPVIRNADRLVHDRVRIRQAHPARDDAAHERLVEVRIRSNRGHHFPPETLERADRPPHV